MKKILVTIIMLLAVSSAFGQEKVDNLDMRLKALKERHEKVKKQLEINEKETEKANLYEDSKEIANVRYFNMAGHEMQEANGMTIVVTTYTDGTTGAVKISVIKNEDKDK